MSGSPANLEQAVAWLREQAVHLNYGRASSKLSPMLARSLKSSLHGEQRSWNPNRDCGGRSCGRAINLSMAPSPNGSQSYLKISEQLKSWTFDQSCANGCFKAMYRARNWSAF